MSQPLLAFNEVDVFYGPIQALKQVSLTVNEGETVALIGANGAGKSTLLMSVFGQPRIAGGEIFYRGEAISRKSTHFIASNGIDVLRPLLWLIVVAYVAMIVQILLVYSGIIKIFARMNPLKFLKGEMPVMGFAFASASSVGTLPINMECTEKMGVSKEVTSFVLPLGATINMDGTAIYQGVCAIFIAQVFGIDLSIGQQLTIVMTAVLASIGTAGVPGSGMIMLAMVLQSVGLPVEGVALVAGVDRILDMMRTTVNVTGDAAVATCVDAMQKRAAARRARKAEKLAKAA